MSKEIKPNFFTGNAQPAPVSLPLIQFMNDPRYRAGYGAWLYDNFDSLVDEYKYYGRFLRLSEFQDTDNPLDF